MGGKDAVGTGQLSRAPGLTLDSGALFAAERGDENVRNMIAKAAAGSIPLRVPAGVLAQVWRGSASPGLAHALSGRMVQVIPLDERTAKGVGALLGRSGTSDIVDASVVLCALVNGDRIVTSDPGDIRRLDPRAHVIPV